jgi:hypothetical protein
MIAYVIGDRYVEHQTSQALKIKSLDVQDSYPLLAVGEQKRSGLILCKSHHAEFAGPGAAVGTLVDQGCETVIAIGAPEIINLATHDDRQKAYGRRIQWVRWLQKITDNPDASQRVEKLFAGLEAFFGSQVLTNLPDEVLALLAGVLPQTVALTRLNFRHSHRLGKSESGPEILFLSPRVLYQAEKLSAPILTSKGLVHLPCFK